MQQGGRAELGCPRFPQFRSARDRLLAGKNCERQLGLQRLFAAGIYHRHRNERGRARYGFACEAWASFFGAIIPTSCVAGNPRPSAVEKLRTDLETQLGQPVFLIADERDRASEISFYLRDKRAEGPGHPPVYIVESQDMLNQFSFWPRYDEFVEQPAASREKNEVYTEENGINPFEGRTALYIQDSGKEQPPHNIRAAFQSTERVDHNRSRGGSGSACVHGDFSLPNLPDAAAMNDHAPAISVVVPLFNEEENVPLLQAELMTALAGLRLRNHLCRRRLDRSHR